MNPLEIAHELVKRSREGQDTFDALYAEHAVSIEAAAMPGMERETKGLAAIKAKSAWWFENHEIHAFSVDGPYPHDDRFIVAFSIDVTHRPSGQRIQMKDMGLYTVEHGKIVREEFFYPTGS